MFSGGFIALGLYAKGRDEMTLVYGKRVLYALFGLTGSWSFSKLITEIETDQSELGNFFIIKP